MEIIAAFIGAIVAAIVTFWASHQTLRDSLDSKSGWREKLFTVASKYELTLDDAQTVRAALRLFPNFDKMELYSFTWFSNIMIVHLDKYILNKDKLEDVTEEDSKSSNTNGYIQMTELSLCEKSEVTVQSSRKLNTMNSQFVRLFAMFLLKYRFDYRSAMQGKEYLFWFNRENKNKRYSRLVKETYGNYKNLLDKWGGLTMAESTKSENSGKKKATLTGCLVFCSTLFLLLIVWGLFFIYCNEKNTDNLHHLNFFAISSVLLLFILAIAISILSGIIVCKRILANDSNLVHITQQDDLKEIWESIYNQENTQSD